MRVAVVYFPARNRDKILETSKKLAGGIEENGHQVDIIDGSRDINTKITIYQYIAFGTQSLSIFRSKLPKGMEEFIKNAGIVSGKRSFAFVMPSFFSSHKTLKDLMAKMEKEGMFLKFSEILTPDIAEETGKKLHIMNPIN